MTTITFTESLSRGVASYNRIASLQESIISTPDKEINLRVETTGPCGRTFLFLLCTLPLFAKAYNKTLRLGLPQKLYDMAEKMDITKFYKNPNSNTSLPDSAFRTISSTGDIIEIVSHITKEAPVLLSPLMLDTLVSKMGEIYLNALGHSETTCIVGGKYFKSSGVYAFSCYDAGIGIPEKVNNFFEANGKLSVSELDAVKWAIAPGNSTSNVAGIPRGAGFQTLHSFARANKGSIRICSGSVYYTFQKSTSRYHSLSTPFKGTMFEMDILADNIHQYILSSEEYND